MEEKAYSPLQLKRVYAYINEALDEKRKEEVANVLKDIAQKNASVTYIVDKILFIEEQYDKEKDMWKKALKIDEINKQDRERFDKVFNSIPNIFKADIRHVQ